MLNPQLQERVTRLQRFLSKSSVMITLLATSAYAQTEFLPTTAAELGLMQGFPILEEKRVDRANFMQYPYSRWGFQNIRELQPTRGIYRGEAPVFPIPETPVDLGSLDMTRAALPELATAKDRAMYRLAVLLGVDAGSLQPEFVALAAIPQPSSNSEMWGISLPFNWTIYDGGRVRSNIELQQELTEARWLEYRQSVLKALAEVESALVAYNNEQQRLAAPDRGVILPPVIALCRIGVY